MDPHSGISRREFLRLLGVNLAALSLPGFFFENRAFRFSPGLIDPAQLPEIVRQILAALPALSIDLQGQLLVHKNGSSSFAPKAPTQWNRERRRPVDRLETGHRWAIVL